MTLIVGLLGSGVPCRHHLVVLVLRYLLPHQIGRIMGELLLVDQIMVNLFFMCCLHHLWICLHIRTLRYIITHSLFDVCIGGLGLHFLFLFFLFLFLHLLLLLHNCFFFFIFRIILKTITFVQKAAFFFFRLILLVCCRILVLVNIRRARSHTVQVEVFLFSFFGGYQSEFLHIDFMRTHFHSHLSIHLAIKVPHINQVVDIESLPAIKPSL